MTACLNTSPSSYCVQSRELTSLKQRLLIAKQHAIAVSQNKDASIHARVVSVQIVRMLEEEIMRKEEVLDRILIEYGRDRYI